MPHSGFSSCLIGIAPEKGIKLAVNDGTREMFSIRNAGRLTTSHEIIAGSFAGIIQLIVTVPYEMVKIRLQMANMATTTVRDVVKDLGIKGLYRGTVPTLFRDVPFCFIFFPLYANLKALQTKCFVDDSRKISEPFHISLVAGIIAGAISGALVTPADLIKTRVQQGLNGNLSLVAFVSNVARTEGLLSLYRGWHTRILVIAPLYGLVSLSYEVQKTWIMRRSM
jgi:solute carrier family 25 aspartate/glutamate transporter 12/13